LLQYQAAREEEAAGTSEPGPRPVWGGGGTWEEEWHRPPKHRSEGGGGPGASCSGYQGRYGVAAAPGRRRAPAADAPGTREEEVSGAIWFRLSRPVWGGGGTWEEEWHRPPKHRELREEEAPVRLVPAVEAGMGWRWHLGGGVAPTAETP